MHAASGRIYFLAKTESSLPQIRAGLNTKERRLHSPIAEAACGTPELMAASLPFFSRKDADGVLTFIWPSASEMSSISSCQCHGMSSSCRCVWREAYPAQGNSVLPCGWSSLDVPLRFSPHC